MGPKTKIGCLIGMLLVFSGCFFGGVINKGKVVGYSPGVVMTQKGSYQVGPLSDSWKRTEVKPYRTISFYSAEHESTLNTDAFCDQAYDDASLAVLTNHLREGLTDVKTLTEKNIMLDGRAALRSVLSAKMDGVPIVLDTVVIKKNTCLFDFMLVADPSHYEKASGNFEKFFGGFKYDGEI